MINIKSFIFPSLRNEHSETQRAELKTLMMSLGVKEETTVAEIRYLIITTIIQLE